MDELQFTFHDHLIEIDKWFFYLDKNKKITYNALESECGMRFDVAYATERDVELSHRSGMKIFVYKNKDSKDGLWHHIVSTDTSYDNIFNLIGAGPKIVKKYNYRAVMTRREIETIIKTNT